jgi:putative spermidine/putrescine transport system ATP-binding protein
VQPKLKIEGVRKSFGSVVALRESSLEMREGEFLTLLGPSGSGKTTLLMMVAGLLRADAGDIWIDGKLATYVPPFKRDIGLVFQNYALFPHLTVFENIAFPLHMRGVPQAGIRTEVARVLDIVQLPHVADRLPRALSGGQQQRIALARCIVYRPSIILMDEPLGALDKKLRDQLQLEIKNLHKQLGTTILYVTHDQQETLTMSDRVCLMNQGMIEQIGTPYELYFQPRTLFAADFLGESNIFEVEIVGSDDRFVYLKSAITSDAVLRAPSIPGFSAGKATAMVRPESIRLIDDRADDLNRIDGTIRDVVFAGGTTKYLLELATGATFVATVLTSSAGNGTGPGTHLSVGWPVGRTVLFAYEGTS